MTNDDAGGEEGGKNGDFWMTSFVNDPLIYIFTKTQKLGMSDRLFRPSAVY